MPKVLLGYPSKNLKPPTAQRKFDARNPTIRQCRKKKRHVHPVFYSYKILHPFMVFAFPYYLQRLHWLRILPPRWCWNSDRHSDHDKKTMKPTKKNLWNASCPMRSKWISGGPLILRHLYLSKRRLKFITISSLDCLTWQVHWCQLYISTVFAVIVGGCTVYKYSRQL